jgi:hypothetical protein
MRETTSNLWRIDEMFGLDQLFDFDRNGKLDAFERAAEVAFLYSAEGASRKADRRYGDQAGFDRYGSNYYYSSEYSSEEDDSD